MEETGDRPWVDDAFAELGGFGEEEDVPEQVGRLRRQVGFLLEIDKAKSIARRTYVTDGSHLENDAEHMWHAVLAALILAEHANGAVDPMRLACMLAVHDIVEIDAGDTFVYDTTGHAGKAERETAAADRIFGLLPSDQGEQFRALWDEFEARETDTSKMAAAIDRLLPLLMNRAVDGRTWSENGITADRVFALNSRIADGSAQIWEFARLVLEGAVRDGALHEA
ncbi:MAG: HD domain-containing protein [Acidimicrobiales bacterium]